MCHRRLENYRLGDTVNCKITGHVRRGVTGAFYFGADKSDLWISFNFEKVGRFQVVIQRTKTRGYTASINSHIQSRRFNILVIKIERAVDLSKFTVLI